jgi:tripartite-type tricarboxylate transporter receptor subunit TctC
MKLDRRTLLGAGLATVALLSAPEAIAASGSWSSEPVRIVVTFPPGGTSDLVARLLAKHLHSDFGQKAVVDNRPGAAGTVAADYVSQQDPDGTTLILSNNAPFTIAPTRFKSIPYKPIDGFTHVAYIGASAPGLFVQPLCGALLVTD